MFTPAAFAETDLAWLDRLLARDPVVTLVTVDGDGLPQASPLPVLYRRDGQQVLIEGHWAAANPQCRHRGPALVLVHGPHAYLSPGWYPDKHAAARVPTWNYATAQLRGELETFDDPVQLADLVARLSARHEARVGGDWQMDAGDPRQRRMLGGIVGFRFRPAAIALKLKFSQNHPPANQQAVIGALAASDQADARRTGQWMQLRLSCDGHNRPGNPDDAAIPRPFSPNPSGTPT